MTATKDVSFDVSFLTARFETADQIAAFGGRNGILRSCYDRTMSLLMIGTVKNDLFAQLESAAKSAAGSYEFKVINVAAGSQYTIFMLTEERFWASTASKRSRCPTASRLTISALCGNRLRGARPLCPASRFRC